MEPGLTLQIRFKVRDLHELTAMKFQARDPITSKLPAQRGRTRFAALDKATPDARHRAVDRESRMFLVRAVCNPGSNQVRFQRLVTAARFAGDRLSRRMTPIVAKLAWPWRTKVHPKSRSHY